MYLDILQICAKLRTCFRAQHSFAWFLTMSSLARTVVLVSNSCKKRTSRYTTWRLNRLSIEKRFYLSNKVLLCTSPRFNTREYGENIILNIILIESIIIRKITHKYYNFCLRHNSASTRLIAWNRFLNARRITLRYLRDFNKIRKNPENYCKITFFLLWWKSYVSSSKQNRNFHHVKRA